MPIPDYQTLMLPVLQASANGVVRMRDIVEPIADAFGLTQEEREAQLPSGRQAVIHNRCHWAKFYLGKAGLLESPSRGKFTATADGRALLATNPTRIDNQYLRRYPRFVTFLDQQAIQLGVTIDESVVLAPATEAPATLIAASLSPEDQLHAADLVLQAAVRSDVLGRLLQRSPTFFEQVVIDLLVAMGYGGSHAEAASRIGRSGDGGVDGVIDEDRLGLDRIYVQAKRYTDAAVTPMELRAFVGSLEHKGATKGVFVTTSTFSRQAIAETEQVRSKRIKLIDGELLAQLMIEHGVGVRVARRVNVYTLDENYFSDD